MKRTNRVAGGRPFIMPPSCLDQEGQALSRLYQRATFRVKQESGFVFEVVQSTFLPMPEKPPVCCRVKDRLGSEGSPSVALIVSGKKRPARVGPACASIARNLTKATT
jgi:hypothetical protein